MSFQSIKFRGSELFLLLDCMAKAFVKECHVYMH